MIQPTQKKHPYYNPSQLLKRISINPQICHGQPCIKGHRIMVHQILGLLSSGLTPKEITGESFFPSIKVDDIYACIAFANKRDMDREERLFKKLMRAR